MKALANVDRVRRRAPAPPQRLALARARARARPSVVPRCLAVTVVTAVTASQNIDLFCELMPPSGLAAAKAQIEEENRLNDAEYREVNDDPLLNAPPPKPAPAA